MAQHDARRLALWRCAPALAGISVALFWAWWHGEWMVFGQPPWGYGWFGYAEDAWLVTHGLAHRTDALRTLVYPGLLGHLGESLGSYADAGVLISSLAVLVCVVACGIAAGILGGGWAGGLAAILVSVVLAHQEAATMMNQYPLLAAGCAAVMALAMVVMRWPRTTWGIGLGLCAGAVWMVESRGLVVAPLVLGAVAIGGSRGRARHPWRLAVVVGVSFLLCALARAELASAQRRSVDRHAQNTSQLVDRQRDVVLRWIEAEGEVLEAVCGGVQRAELLKPSFLGTPCSRAIFWRNLEWRLPSHLPLGMALSLMMALCALLPGGRGRRDVAESALVVVGVGSGLVLLAFLTLMPRRYLLQVAPLMATAGAVGAARLGGLLGKQTERWGLAGHWAPAAVCLGLALWTLSAGSGGHAWVERAQLGPHYERYRELGQRMQAEVSVGDGLMDCSEHQVELTLLPLRTHRDVPSKQADAGRCQSWIDSPWTQTSRAWMLIGDDDQTRWRRNTRPEPSLGVQLSQRPEWSLHAAGSHWEIWRWDG